jgi:hypothetical protein
MTCASECKRGQVWRGRGGRRATSNFFVVSKSKQHSSARTHVPLFQERSSLHHCSQRVLDVEGAPAVSMAVSDATWTAPRNESSRSEWGIKITFEWGADPIRFGRGYNVQVRYELTGCGESRGELQRFCWRVPKAETTTGHCHQACKATSIC